jgi:AcrR family transcriptional regulator
MGAAGLTVGGFYAHFDSKDELMLEAFSQLLAERRAFRRDRPELMVKGVVRWSRRSICRASTVTPKCTRARCRLARRNAAPAGGFP